VRKILTAIAMFETMPHSAHIRRVFATVATLANGLAPVATFAENVAPIQQTVDASEASVTSQADKSNFSFVAIPVPVTNAAIGNGLGAASAFLYKLDAESPASYTGVGAFYTDKHSWALGAMQKTNLFGDKIHLNVLAGYYNFHYDFFGIGEASGAQGNAVPLLQSGAALIPEALFRIFPHVYLGARYRYIGANTSIDLATVSSRLHLSLPENQLQIISSGVGPVAEYDSRNDTFSPSSGSYARVEANFAERALLTSNQSYRTVDGSYNGYRETGENGVLAYRFSACSASDGTPFFDLCSFGTNGDLRGYTPGQYIDKTSFAAQVEYRWRFWDPFGLVGFGGVGGVAPSFGDYQFDKLLSDIGVGLRYRASDKYPVNIGFDFAVGKRSSAYYFRIGEAF
jgi:hypothetical protein